MSLKTEILKMPDVGQVKKDLYKVLRCDEFQPETLHGLMFLLQEIPNEFAHNQGHQGSLPSVIQD